MTSVGYGWSILLTFSDTESDQHGVDGPVSGGVPSRRVQAIPDRVDGVERVVAVLGRGVIPATTPILRADDLGVVRGDGVFETAHVRSGRPWLLDEHLDRMARSAARLDLDLPSRDDLVGLADTLCAGWPADVEGALKLICTRGPEDGDDVTCYGTLTAVPDSTRATRRNGLRLGTLNLGVNADARSSAPWLLGGAKTLSYAMNMACQRWATGAGLESVT